MANLRKDMHDETIWTPDGFSIAALKEHGLLEEDDATRHSMSAPHEGRQSKRDKIIQTQAGGRMETLAQALKSGELNFPEIFREVRKVAFAYKDASEKLKAIQLLKTWLDEVRKEAGQYEMADRDVVDLLSKALSSIDRRKYIEVLSICRKTRQELIRKRNKVIDVDAIIRDEQNKKAGFSILSVEEQEEQEEQKDSIEDLKPTKKQGDYVLPKRFNESTSF